MFEMITQPELGKKIADCRKAKGFTQKELVEKCKLSVRTLQRIEAGEVTPRIYTIKVICEALELDYVHYFGFNFFNNLESISRFFLEAYLGFLDLFKFKTNTLKKIATLLIMIAVMITGVFAFNARLSAADHRAKNLNNTVIKVNSSGKDLPLYDLSCEGYMEKNGLIIGRDISFKLNGVTFKNVRLLALDKKTLEFDAQFVEGHFSEKKVIIDYQKNWFTDHSLGYTADKVLKTDSEIILKGHAMVYDLNSKDNPKDDEAIKADEILILLK